MGRVKTDKVLVSFSGGEWEPGIDSRIDLAKAASACRTLKNFRTDIYGGAVKRPGLRFIGSLKGTAPLFTCGALGTAWYENVLEAGGTASLEDRNIICTLAAALESKPYFDSLWLYCPFVGRDLNAALVPLINRLANNVGQPEGSFRLYPVGMTNANFAPAEGLKNADGTHYVLQGEGAFSALYTPNTGLLGNARAFGYWELGTITGSNSVIGFYDDRNSVPNNQTPWRYTFAASNVLAVGYTGIWSQVNPNSRWEVAHTTTPGLYTWAYKPAEFGRIWRNGVSLLDDTTVADQFGSSMRAALMATSFIDFGSPNTGIEPDSVFECLDTRLGCYYSGDADVLGTAELLDLYETTRDLLMTPTGRI